MAPKKKLKSKEHSDEEAVKEELYNDNEEIQVEFEGRYPIDGDFHGIKQLLSQLFLKAPINIGELATQVINQSQVGSVIQQSTLEDSDEDSDSDENLIFGITSILDLSDKETESMNQVCSYIIKKAEKNLSDSMFSKLKEILNDKDKKVGLLINERFINIPCQISVPIFDSLNKELAKAISRNSSYDFTYILMFIKFYRKPMKKNNNKPMENIYSNQEEEVFVKKSFLDFDYSVENEKDTGFSGNWMEDDVNLIPYRKVVIFETNKLTNIISSIREYING